MSDTKQVIQVRLAALLSKVLNIKVADINSNSNLTTDLFVLPEYWLDIGTAIVTEFKVEFDILLAIKTFAASHTSYSKAPKIYQMLNLQTPQSLISFPLVKSILPLLTVKYLVDLIHAISESTPRPDESETTQS